MGGFVSQDAGNGLRACKYASACVASTETWPFTSYDTPVQVDVLGAAAAAAHLRYQAMYGFAYPGWEHSAEAYDNYTGFEWGGDGVGYGLDTGGWGAPLEGGRPTHVMFNAGHWEVAFSSFSRFAHSPCSPTASSGATPRAPCLFSAP